MIISFLNLCISRCEGTNSHGGGAILVSDTRTMVWKGKPVTEDTRCNHNLSFKTLRAFKLSNFHNAQYAFCKVYFSAQPNKLRPILKFRKYYPVEHIFVPACSSARKIHFFKF